MRNFRMREFKPCFTRLYCIRWECDFIHSVNTVLVKNGATVQTLKKLQSCNSPTVTIVKGKVTMARRLVSEDNVWTQAMTFPNLTDNSDPGIGLYILSFLWVQANTVIMYTG